MSVPIMRPAPPAVKNIIVGIVFLVGVGVLIVCMLMLGDNPPGYGPITIVLPDANGLKPGDTVYLLGVDIGRAKQLDIAEKKVHARIVIKDDHFIRIPKDSFFYVWDDNFILGRKCIEIAPGDAAEPIEPGDTVEGESSRTKVLLRLKISDPAKDAAEKTGEVLEKVGSKIKGLFD